MTDSEIEAMLRAAARGRPSAELDDRMRALFAEAHRNRRRVPRVFRPVPAWALAAACAISAAGGFFANALWQPRGALDPIGATVTICMLDPNRPLARRFLGPAEDREPRLLSDYQIRVRAGDTGGHNAP
ncbi:MAG: hypothetical protein IT577_05085 [Verrucomicrobiae bacterium]|nr:hypothetical protein [Verrucomicrobiae bacterium]